MYGVELKRGEGRDEHEFGMDLVLLLLFWNAMIVHFTYVTARVIIDFHAGNTKPTSFLDASQCISSTSEGCLLVAATLAATEHATKRSFNRQDFSFCIKLKRTQQQYQSRTNKISAWKWQRISYCPIIRERKTHLLDGHD
jgi:hypothetical protein